MLYPVHPKQDIDACSQRAPNAYFRSASHLGVRRRPKTLVLDDSRTCTTSSWNCRRVPQSGKLPITSQAESCVFWKRPVLHPSARISAQKSVFSSSSRASPVFFLTWSHIVVTRITFGITVAPHKLANVFRCSRDGPDIRLSVMRCK